MIWSILLLLLGLALVVKGADFLVDGASSLAKRKNVPELVIGLTIVAFGTSAPELVVNIFASVAGKNDLALGNIIGSNIFNLLFILGISGLIFPLTVHWSSVRREIPFSLLAVVIFYILANDNLLRPGVANSIDRLDAVILLVFFGMFLYITFGPARGGNESGGDVAVFSLLKTWIYIVLGFVGLFLGGKLVVDQAVIIARELGVSEKLIGLTIVASGTSLPELATSAVAAYKKRCDLAVGNVVGSNIFNLLFIMGVSAGIGPVAYPTSFNMDLYILGVGTLLLLVMMFTGKRRLLDRWEAFIMLLAYLVYLSFIIMRK